MLVFEERGNRSTRRKPLSAEQTPNKLNPRMTRQIWESNPGHTGGRRMPSLHPQEPKEHRLEHKEKIEKIFKSADCCFQ